MDVTMTGDQHSLEPKTGGSCPHPSTQLLFEGLDADEPKRTPVHIVRCDQCGLAFSKFVGPIPDDLYVDGYYGETVSDRKVNSTMINFFQKERQGLTVRQVNVQSVFDVGCGDGTYLDHLDPSKYKKFGFDPSVPGRKSIEAKSIEYVDFNTNNELKVDMITMWHSLEHVESPLDSLLKAKKYLEPNGHLFVSIPNFKSLQAQLFKGYWFHLDPTRHLYHFTLESFKELAKKAGFKIESVGTMSFEYGLFGWWQSFMNLLPFFEFNFIYKVLKSRKKFTKNFYYYFQLLMVLIVGGPLLALSTIMFFIACATGKGSVLNIRMKIDNKGEGQS